MYHNSESYCFDNTKNSIGQWNYFATSSHRTDSNYQWLLIQLSRPVRLLSVTIMKGSIGPSENTENVEIQHTDALPTGFVSPRSGSRCKATLRMRSLRSCGTAVSVGVDHGKRRSAPLLRAASHRATSCCASIFLSIHTTGSECGQNC
uniref:MIR domain-containing protein n=1 Tax=Macrostomum lignano TaxID=282301 RepID=A0A1I8HM00_9PLAT